MMTSITLFSKLPSRGDLLLIDKLTCQYSESRSNYTLVHIRHNIKDQKRTEARYIQNIQLPTLAC